MGEWKVIDPNPNPIVGYTVGFEYQRPLDEASLVALSDAHGQFRRELPRRNEQRAVTLLQLGGPPLSVGPHPLAGVAFSSFRPDGTIGKTLSAVQQTISFMIADYQRWAEFWPQAERLLRVMADHGPKELPVIALLLNANNRFEWSSSDEPPDLRLILREDSVYVAPHLLTCRDAAHSFHGFVDIHAEPPGTRLDNIMIASIPAKQGSTHLDVNFSFRLQLESPFRTAAEMFVAKDSDPWSSLRIGLESLHQLNNRLFCATIAPSIVERIPGLPQSC